MDAGRGGHQASGSPLSEKMWISIICALAGALLGGGLYLIVHVAFAPARVYEGVSKVYLTFAADDDGDAYQYYNGYTWNDLMKNRADSG